MPTYQTWDYRTFDGAFKGTSQWGHVSVGKNIDFKVLTPFRIPKVVIISVRNLCKWTSVSWDPFVGSLVEVTEHKWLSILQNFPWNGTSKKALSVNNKTGWLWEIVFAIKKENAKHAWSPRSASEKNGKFSKQINRVRGGFSKSAILLLPVNAGRQRTRARITVTVSSLDRQSYDHWH